ncbi:hypothetical protein RSAG8_00651, partial [Rhizoctonia solani AG-8 WAC10335]
MLISTHEFYLPFTRIRNRHLLGMEQRHRDTYTKVQGVLERI